ncbi:MAG: 50S ribosomal protein L4, partial [uncultured bacterium]
GTKGSPIWVHGGVAFGPKPRDVYYDIPKKVRKKAIKESFLMKVRDDEVIIADVLDVNEPKTKLANDLLKRLNLSGSKVLMVTSKIKSNLILSIRNIKKVSVLPVNELNPMTIINAGKLVFEKEAYQEFEKNYLNK